MLKCDLEDTEDKSMIGKYRSLYIVTFEKEKWGIKAGQALAKGRTNEFISKYFR